MANYIEAWTLNSRQFLLLCWVMVSSISSYSFTWRCTGLHVTLMNPVDSTAVISNGHFWSTELAQYIDARERCKYLAAGRQSLCIHWQIGSLAWLASKQKCWHVCNLFQLCARDRDGEYLFFDTHHKCWTETAIWLFQWWLHFISMGPGPLQLPRQRPRCRNGGAINWIREWHQIEISLSLAHCPYFGCWWWKNTLNCQILQSDFSFHSRQHTCVR